MSGFNGPPRRKQPLYVIPMALALLLAAFAGAAIGLIWLSSGGGGEAGREGVEGEGPGEADDSAAGRGYS